MNLGIFTTTNLPRSQTLLSIWSIVKQCKSGPLMRLLTNISVFRPNPIETLPLYSIQAKNPISTMTGDEIKDFLGGRLQKRDFSSSVARPTIQKYLSTCPLAQLPKSDILIGCLGGIYAYCQVSGNDLSICHDYYDTTFANSIYDNIGRECPAWKSGPNSVNCQIVANDFHATLAYTTISKSFAKLLIKTILNDTNLAPCIESDCNWGYPTTVPTRNTLISAITGLFG